MAVKTLRRIIGFVFLVLLLTPVFSLADPPPAGTSAPENNVEPASRPSDCKTYPVTVKGKRKWVTPMNCIYLEEPIGGRPNYDLFVKNCAQIPDQPEGCTYTLWGGGAITGDTEGPVQAIISFHPNKKEERGLTLLYNYLSLIYRYASGVIVGVAVLFVIVGGVQMTTAAGDTSKFDSGKKRIIQAITGMIVWFLASLILYTINPTFFAF